MKLTSLLAWFLGLLLAFRGSAADANFFGVIKLQQYAQSNASAPIIASNGYSFQAFVNASAKFAITNATVKPGNSTPSRTLTPDSQGLIFRFEDNFPSQSALDATYPNGTFLSPVNYTNTLFTIHDGIRSATVNFFLLFVPLSYPATPQIQNWPAAQAIDHTADFKLVWNNLGGSALAIVQLLILDASSNVVFATPAPFQPGALDGSSTSATVPALTLPPGANLIAHLTIANPGTPNTNSYPGAVGISALTKDNSFTLATRPAPVRPHLTVLPKASGNFALRLEGETNRIYHLEATTDFLSWTNLITTNSDSGLFNHADPASPTIPSRFYRGRVGQ
jgi:hypothetical protein